MKYARVTISIQEDLLAEVDAEASGTGASRSSVIQEATARYVTGMRTAEAAAEHRRSVGLALEGMRKLRERLPLDPRPTLELLREIRENDDFVTPRSDPPEGRT
jgi:hypothetical protein